MKKKTLKLNRLVLKKEMIGALKPETVKGGATIVCSVGCSMRCTIADLGNTCAATACNPCQTGGCPSLDTHCDGCGIGG